MEDIKKKLVNFLTYRKDTQYHINLAVWLNWFSLALFLFAYSWKDLMFATNLGFWTMILIFFLLIIWEIIFWKKAWIDSIKDILVAFKVLAPFFILLTIIKLNLL